MTRWTVGVLHEITRDRYWVQLIWSASYDLGPIWEFPKIRGTLGPYHKDPTIWGTILGTPIFGNSHIGAPNSNPHVNVETPEALNPTPL